jgi:hypothetical protein
MKLTDKNGNTVEMTYDEEGFPTISINTSCTSADNRPCIEVTVNNVVVHEMFENDEPDYRCQISCDEIKELVAQEMSRQTGYKILPADLKEQTSGEYDYESFDGFSVEISGERIATVQQGKRIFDNR